MAHAAEDLDALYVELDRTGGDLRVVGLLVPVFDHAGHADAGFLLNARRKVHISENDLHDAVHITEVNKKHAAVIPDIFHPAGKSEFLSNVFFGHLIHRQVSVTF